MIFISPMYITDMHRTIPTATRIARNYNVLVELVYNNSLSLILTDDITAALFFYLVRRILGLKAIAICTPKKAGKRRVFLSHPLFTPRAESKSAACCCRKVDNDRFPMSIAAAAVNAMHYTISRLQNRERTTHVFSRPARL